MADARAQFAAFKKDKIDTGEVKSGQLFGTKGGIAGQLSVPDGGAVIGIFANPTPRRCTRCWPPTPPGSR